MAGPLVWWANRKSRIGMSPAAMPPPHLPNGKEWWTEPPTACPQPEFIEYAVKFACELYAQNKTPKRDALLKFVAEWLRFARRLLHEEAQAPERADLHTTDGIIVSANRALHMMRSRIYGLGGSIDDDVKQICEAVEGRASKIRRERAMESAKTRSVSAADRERLGR